MSKLKVFDAAGTSSGELDVADSLLELEKGSQAVQDVVVAHMAARRAGTASTLAKGEVSGTGAKPHRQKGTGRARAGYRQSPVWRGGSVAFGPKPRSYAKKVNRKVARLAFRRVFSEKVQAGQVCVVEGLDIAEPKTKLFAAVAKALDVQTPALFLVDVADDKVLLAARNLASVDLVKACDVSVYQLLRAHSVVATRAAMDVIKGRLGEKAEVAE